MISIVQRRDRYSTKIATVVAEHDYQCCTKGIIKAFGVSGTKGH